MNQTRSRALTRGNPYRWAILVYMAGDNDLSNECVWALKEMHRVGAPEGVAVAAQFDSQASGKPTRRIVIRSQSATGDSPPGADETTDLEATSSSDPEGSAFATSVRNFVKWGVETFPADHLMVVLSGHGSAAEGERLLWDDDPPRFLSIPRLRWALRDGTRSLPAGRRIDILGFDACAMASAEIALEMRGVAKFMVAAEGFELTTGWPYHRILRALERRPDWTPESLAREIVDRYVDYYLDFVALAGSSVELCACDLEKLEPLAEAVEGLAEALIKSSSDRSVVDAVLLAHWSAQSYKLEEYVDLWDFCDLLRNKCPDPRVRGLSEAVKRAVEGCVVKSRSCGVAYQHSHGMAVYFPWVEDRTSLAVDPRILDRECRFLRAICRKLTTGRERSRSLARIWGVLSEPSRKVVEKISRTGKPSGFLGAELLSSALNEAVLDPELYDEEAFAELFAGEATGRHKTNWVELKQLKARREGAPRDFPETDSLRMNRLLVQIALNLDLRSGQLKDFVQESSRYRRLLWPARSGWGSFLVHSLEKTRRAPRGLPQIVRTSFRELPTFEGRHSTSSRHSSSSKHATSSRFLSALALGLGGRMKNSAVEEYCERGG